jgi:hypothetical protein
LNHDDYAPASIIVIDGNCQVSGFRSLVGYESPIREPIMKSRFFDLDDKEVENVNLGGRRVSKHAEVWAKNAFDKWKQLRGFDMTKLIADLFKDKGSVKNLVDMLSTFVL